MKTNRVKQLILGAFAAVVLMSGVFTTTAEAQTRGVRRHRPNRVIVYRPYWYNPFYTPFYSPFYDPFWGSSLTYRVVDPIAYQKEQGYREGKDEGKDDAKKGLPANPTGDKHYLKSDSVHFREAFVQGYNDGYREKKNDLLSERR